MMRMSIRLGSPHSSWIYCDDLPLFFRMLVLRIEHTIDTIYTLIPRYDAISSGACSRRQDDTWICGRNERLEAGPESHIVGLT